MRILNQLNQLFASLGSKPILLLFLLLPFSKKSSSQDTVNISGVITDTSGNGLMGASVLIKGTSNGTTSGNGGHYTIQARSGNVLIFSHSSYETQEIEVGNTPILNITLRRDISNLADVVVIGYGTMKKFKVTGAITKMSNVDALAERPVARIDQAMVGQMSGVRVKRTSGIASKGLSIEVRGGGSLGGNNEPLYVIDGFPQSVSNPNGAGNFSVNPLDNINPDDIESIEVLKDASSSAIYGSRAANGVVLITTKSGSKGKAKLSVNAKTGVSRIAKKYDVLNTDEWIERATEMINAKYISSGLGRSVSDDTPTRIAKIGSFDNSQVLDDRWSQPNYGGLIPVDWQDAIFKQGLLQEYNLSANGGSDFIKYYVSANYLNQEGTAIGMDYKLYSTRINIEANATKKLLFGLNLNPSFAIKNDGGMEGKDLPLFHAISINPIVEADQGLNQNSFDKGVYVWSKQNEISPVAQLKYTKNEDRIFRNIASLYAQYEILSGLRLKSTLNLNNDDWQNEYFRPSYISGTLSSRVNTPGLFSNGSFSGFRQQNFLNENTLSYLTSLFDKHDISLLAGTSYNSINTLSWGMSSFGGYLNDDIYTLNNAAGINSSSNTTRSANAMFSVFGRLQYSYENKYLFSGSIRRDGSSRFGTNTRWGVFPAASIGWRVTEESFMPKTNALTELKLRASWGKSGSDNFGNYEQFARLTSASYSFNNQMALGIAPANIANPHLSWEESQTFDIGADIGLLSNRIHISADYYTKKSKNLLLNIPVPRVTGFSSSSTNIGEVQNKGWELEVSANLLDQEFKWNVSANLSHNKNRVLKLGPNNSPITNLAPGSIAFSILAVGHPMYEMYLIKQIGILSAKDISDKVAITQGETEGDPKYYDANGNGVIDIDDRMYLGDPNPKLIWGFNMNLSYKGFDLSATIQGQYGGLLYSSLGRGVDGPAWQFFYNQIGHNRDRWRSAEDPGKGIRGKAYSTMQRTPVGNTDWLYSSNYWRIPYITLGYNLGKIVQNKMISKTRIYVAFENYFGGDKYDGGVNPEAVNISSSGGMGVAAGTDYGAYPLIKTMVIGLNFIF